MSALRALDARERERERERSGGEAFLVLKGDPGVWKDKAHP